MDHCNYIKCIFNINLSEEFLRRGIISRQIRLSLPYATPPHLSLIMMISICILFFNKKLFAKRTRIILIGIFFVILLLTSSRTGIAAGIIVILISLFLRYNQKFNIRKFINLTIGILCIIILLLVFNSEYINKLIGRFIITDITQDRHLLVPLEGILIWLSDIRIFLIGIGYGSSINLQGRFTYLPSHFLNSFVTLIAEKGLIGLMIVFEYIRLLANNLNALKIRKLSDSYKAIGYSYLIIMISFLFYESKQNISVWVIISIIYMMDRYKKPVKED